MTSLASAKILFFIAMTMHPTGAHTIYATSTYDNYLWTQDGGSWTVETRTLATDDWQVRNEEQPPLTENDWRTISRHHWGSHSSVDLANGNRVEKNGDSVFYIVDPGAANQKTYTILFPTDS